MNHHVSRKHVAVALAPVAGIVGIGLTATAAHAESGSPTVSIVDTDGNTHNCFINYDLVYDFAGAGSNTLEASIQSSGDPICSAGLSQINVDYEQASDHVEVSNFAGGNAAFVYGYWYNVRNVDNVPNHKITAFYTIDFTSNCDPVATQAAFGHDCDPGFNLSHGK